MNVKIDEKNSIAADIRMLETFASGLTSFFQRYNENSLFKRLPPRETSEVTMHRLAEGHYLLRPTEYQIQADDCWTIALDLFDLLKKNLSDQKEALTRIQDVFVTKKVKAIDFLTSVFSNQGNDVIKVVRKFDLSEDLTTFFAIYLARPFRARAACLLTEDLDLNNWSFGNCPVCGNWAALGHIAGEDGHRTLWCLHCATRWSFKRIQCAYCLNNDHETLEIISPVSQESYRVQVCNKCRRYLKEVRSNETVDKFPFDAVYLGTLALDVLAKKEGYIQESNLTVRYDNPDGNESTPYHQEINRQESS